MTYRQIGGDMMGPFTRVWENLKRETVRQLMSLACRWSGDSEEGLDRMLVSMLHNMDLRKGLHAMILELAFRNMRPSTAVFTAMCESRLAHHDPERGEGYKQRPPQEHLGQLKRKVAMLEQVVANRDNHTKVAMMCVDIANYAQFIALTKGELNQFMEEPEISTRELAKVLNELKVEAAVYKTVITASRNELAEMREKLAKLEKLTKKAPAKRKAA
jgi:hypothetical protein